MWVSSLVRRFQVDWCEVAAKEGGRRCAIAGKSHSFVGDSREQCKQKDKGNKEESVGNTFAEDAQLGAQETKGRIQRLSARNAAKKGWLEHIKQNNDAIQ